MFGLSLFKSFLDMGISIPLLLALYLSLEDQQNSPTTSSTYKHEYDYIIVGAGAAGSALANRLTEEECATVLLLEAGYAPPHVDDVPGFSRSLWFSYLDWAYKTVPQKHVGSALKDRKVIWPSGLGLGGSTLINAMMYVRGSKDNYNAWAAGGATGWGWDDVLPYFKKLEDYKDSEFEEDGYHGTGGPVTVERPNYNSTRKSSLMQAITDNGFDIVDSNGPRMTGFYDFRATMRNGERCSAAKAYLVPAQERENLDILTNARVTKVIFKKNRAKGVVFDWKNKARRVRARKEVILSAGTTNTAQLLMLSGIGPKDQLKKLKIPVVSNLQVGSNFHDHFSVPIFYEIDSEGSCRSSEIKKYIHNRTGSYASAEYYDMLGFVNTRNGSSCVDKPNIELYFASSTTKKSKHHFGISDKAYDQVFKKYENGSVYLCYCSLTQPRSRGWVRLNSADPYDPPLINPNYLADPLDLEDVVKGMKLCDQIVLSETMRKLNTKALTTKFPGCEDKCGDEYRACMARALVVSMSHQVGVAKMGDPKDPTTVVDPQLRVKGVTGLRVVDASVMPIVISGNTMIPSIMIGEKAADIIKGEMKK